MDPLEEQLKEAGAEWRRSQPEPPALEGLIFGLDRPYPRRPFWQLRTAAVALLLVAATVAIAPRIARLTGEPPSELAGAPRGSQVTLLTSSAPASVCALGAAEGVLVTDSRSGLAIAGTDGVVAPIRWPFGYTASSIDRRTSLFDPSGNVVAVEGDLVRVEGGRGEDGIFGACGTIDRITSLASF